MNVSNVVCAIISIIGQVEVTRTKDPGSVPRKFVNFSLPYFGLSLATALYTSIFICVRLGYEYLKASLSRFDRRRDRILYYLKAVFVVVPVESAAIYSINLLAFVILTAERNSKLSYPQNIHPQLAVRCLSSMFDTDADKDWLGHRRDADILAHCIGLLQIRLYSNHDKRIRDSCTERKWSTER